MNSHAVVWMDYKEAHVFRFSIDDVHKERIKAHNPWRKVHHKAGSIGAGHVHGDHVFFAETAEALGDVTEWLLVEIEMPTVVIVGRQDQSTPLSRAQEMATDIANARLVIIEECGHMAPLEKPAEVSAALRRWLTQ